jgi:hypothetical protein
MFHRNWRKSHFTSFERLRPSDRVILLGAILVVLAAVCAFILFGFAGLGRRDMPFALDIRYFFVAGEMWEQHQSPYISGEFKAAMISKAALQSGSYAYPPSSAPLALVLSQSTLRHTEMLISLLSVASLLCFIYYTTSASTLARDKQPFRLSEDTRKVYILISAAIIVGSPFTAHSVWGGGKDATVYSFGGGGDGNSRNPLL